MTESVDAETASEVASSPSTAVERSEHHRLRHGGEVPEWGPDTDRPPFDPNAPVPVLVLTGNGRSGSTLLADVLATTPGFAHAGEMRYVWQRGFIENRFCSCGDSFEDCAFWDDVRNDIAADGQSHQAPAAIANGVRDNTRIRQLAQLMKAGKGEKAVLDEVHALYRSFRSVSQCDVVIDSSKLPPYALLLDRDPRFEVHVVHLVRDPRGVVFSWGSRKASPDSPGAQMMQMSASKASVLWLLWNSLTLLWWRKAPNYTLVRYEDVVSDPVPTIEKIVAATGRGKARVIEPEPGHVAVGANYGIAGNPDRFERSSRQVRPDNRWKEGLSPWKMRLTTAITAPLLRRFRYPVRR